MAEVAYMTGALVLPEDIQIVPLADLPAQVRAQVGGDTHDYAVTRPRSRAPSKVINAQAAELLRQFWKPTTLVQAILRFSRTTQREPVQVLEDVYPFLESCLIAKLLVAPGVDSKTIRASFDKGAAVANCRVQECVQVLDDTELYRVHAGDLDGALKIARFRSGPDVNRSLRRESKILKRLNGQVAPQILSSGETEDGRAYLVMEWISGELCGEAAAAMRAGTCEPLTTPLVSLCAEVLDAYARLHRVGVVHSDVHANNLLVTENGEVRIIDHGLSRADGDDPELASVPRAGVGFFVEPEYAKAALSSSTLPLSNSLGEQYSVAALVYFLLSGQHCLDFACGEEDMLRQVVEELPFPLSTRGLHGASPLDDVLRRALSKDPGARFPDMGAMAAAFRFATSRLPLPSQPAQRSAALPAVILPAAGDRRLKDWAESILNSLSDPTIDLPICGLKFPTASLTFGATGIAYGVFRMACVREDAGLFALAERWLDRAEREVGQDTAFYHPDVQITPKTVGRVSPYHSPSGLACVQALLAHSAGDLYMRSEATERFLKFSDQACDNPDITVGRSSALLALSLLVDAFHWDTTASHERLIEAGNQLLAGLWEQFDAMPAIGDPNLPTHLGMAHGWAGYLYATLRWIRSAHVPAPSRLQTRLQQLAEQARWRGSRISWPCETSPNSPVLGGWCNGSAGFVFLWTLAHRLLEDPQWLVLAEGAGRDAGYAREEGTSLCCGLTGKAYSQLTLYKHTGDRSWLDNAFAMANLAVRKTTEDMRKAAELRIPLSLYKGDVGLAVLATELEHPESSAMPFFEDETWPRHSPAMA